MGDAGPFGGDPSAAGRKGAARSAEVRKAKSEQRADLRARKAFADESEAVAKELLDAALGREKWARHDGQPVLDPKDRMAALKTCLEYGVGRPRPQDAIEPEKEEAPKTGIRFGVADAETDPPVAPGAIA